jgi:ferredoxin
MSIKLDKESCQACGQCLDVCNSGALHIKSSPGHARVSYNEKLCTGCKNCLHDVDCPGEALRWMA